MNLLPKSSKEFSQKDYWDSFFKKRTKAFEWYGEYAELSNHLHKYIKQQDNILISGCGNSTLGRDLFDIGYKNIVNIDISNIVIKQMLSQNEKERPGLKYVQMDATATNFEDGHFSVVFDKGTLDALMPDESMETLSTVQKYFSEINRVLKIGGRYICISLLQEQILKALLDYFPKTYLFRIVRCFEAEQRAVDNGENAMPVFMVICTKFKTNLPNFVLELGLTNSDKMQRVSDPEDVKKQIANIQETSFICASLKNSTLAGKVDENNELFLDLYQPMDKINPRYTVYVVDTPFEAKNAQYAAFIVPQGREAEWLFSTKEGRKKLIKITQHNRLAIVLLNRNHQYDSLESIQQELNEIVCNLAPGNLKNKKIPFLSLGSDVGQRIIRHKGHSSLSGDYIVEDVTTDSGTKFRRLYFLSTQSVIQSEAKLKSVKSRKGGATKDHIDLNYLTCRHHVYMSSAASIGNNNKSVAVIGLGGGGLCSFLHKLQPNWTILGVEIDEEMLRIARDWFGFQTDDKLLAEIRDGIEFLKESANKNIKKDAILFDVDSKDTSIGMSCPPKQFLKPDVLKNVVKILSNSGIFILNLVLRDVSLRDGIVKTLKKHFKSIFSYKLEEDLNEIFICTVSNKIDEGAFKMQLRESSNKINMYFKKHNVNKDEFVDVDEFLKLLVIN